MRLLFPSSSLCTLLLLCSSPALAQQTNNSSTLNNSAAPSASSITSGGTNINYQTNNSFNNENGFAPGIFCRTPSLYVGGNWGETKQNALDIADNTTSNYNGNYSANIGLVVPFGSSILKQCADLATQITLDRKISTDLSLIRACQQLEKEGIVVDPQRFPYLEKCAKGSVSSTRISQPPPSLNPAIPALAPKTPRTTKS